MVIINIDTKNDSVEELKKTIKYLQELVAERANVSGVAESNVHAKKETVEFVDLLDAYEQEIVPQQPTEPAKQSSSEAALAQQSSSSSVKKKPDAEKLLEEAEKITFDDDDEAFIEIVEYD